MAFQIFQAIEDRETLSALQRSQQSNLEQAIKTRQQLEALAGETARLAAGGHENAQAIVDEMKKQGVTLSPPKK